MKNRIRYKRCLVGVVLAALACVVLSFWIHNMEYRAYNENYNNKISSIVAQVLEKYPETDEVKIIEALNSSDKNADDLLKKYGIDTESQTVLKVNDKDYSIFSLLYVGSVLLALMIPVVLFVLYENRKSRELKEITDYIEQINRRNYDLAIDSISEDELSILKNELYKTTVMLKEVADNSNSDKINLKKSLEDISHQIKTPLTSVIVMIDNMTDDPEMDEITRMDFIKSIKRELVNISFLVQEILKLSKFDSNTISFARKRVELKEIIDESVRNVSALCDLKSVEIETKQEGNPVIVCDKKWQIEAVTNILKNCIDHSDIGSAISVECSDNNVYSMIQISDRGEGISQKDLPHIFERFYKGENATSDSVGIGLALAKTIVEEDNGVITVDSDETGTRFCIKYLK